MKVFRVSPLFQISNSLSVMNITIDDVTRTKAPGYRRMYLFTTPFIITEDKARELQLALGYHPAGYGFYDFRVEGNFTTWMCSDNCD